MEVGMSGPDLAELGASKAAIALHYDTGNDFFRLWLDQPTMSYSCALYDDQAEPVAEDLGDVQRRKIDFYLDGVRVIEAGRLLDVGCGWGGALHRAMNRGFGEAVGLTRSEAQADFIEAAPRPGLSVRRESWVDHDPCRPYDAIISIEAFEAFARLGLSPEHKALAYRSFFERCWRWLRPGGCLGLQTIAYNNADASHFDDFIASEVFPQQDLPHLNELAGAFERLFEVVLLRNDPLHYVATLREWMSRLKRHREPAVALVGASEVVRFERYLRLASLMFEIRSCALYRVILRRIDRPQGRPVAQSRGKRDGIPNQAGSPRN
jgi:cyclopropane-fatty-acyl-phospholipid synthase